MPANVLDVLNQMRAAGLDVEDLEIGRPVRCRVDGDRRNQKSGYYSLFEFRPPGEDLLIVGAFGNFREGGAPHKIQFDRSQKITSEGRAAIRKRMAIERSRAEAERKRQNDEVARRASRMWREKCLPVSGGHDYLTRKQVRDHDIRLSNGGALVIPMRDINARIHGLQLILSRDKHEASIKKMGRDKTFFPSGVAKRGHFHIIGTPTAKGVMLIAEGYATAASLFEATGLPCAVAFDAGNLGPVAEVLRGRYKNASLLICADDDFRCKCRSCGRFTNADDPDCAHCKEPHGKTNTGQNAAATAAIAVSGEVIAPVFADRGTKKLTDWNDLAVREGQSVVRSQLEDKIKALGWEARAAEEVARKYLSWGAGKSEPLRSFISVDEACARFSLVNDVKDLMFDHQYHKLIPKSCVMDITPDHAWREWKPRPDRKITTIDRVGFDPGGKDPNIECNLWAGWPTVPDNSGSCERLLELLEFLCSSESNPRDLYRWMLCWLAYPIQYPGAKMKTSPAFRGGQGAGKNLFFDHYMAIFGEYGRVIGQADLEDRFNDWASRRLFLVANEVVARQERFHTRNILKALITDDWIRINPKNIAAHDERNHVNMVFLSNELQPVVLDVDDRRFAVIKTPDKRPPEFYREVLDEIDNGGVAALHHHLLRNVDVSDFNPGTLPPNTAAKSELIRISKESPDRFIDDLIAGDLDYECQACSLADIYIAYQRWTRAEGERYAYAKNMFSAHVNNRADFHVKRKAVKTGPGKSRVMSVVLPQYDQKPDSESWMDWLGDKVSMFKDKIKVHDDF